MNFSSFFFDYLLLRKVKDYARGILLSISSFFSLRELFQKLHFLSMLVQAPYPLALK